jgi:hypothetical protein
VDGADKEGTIRKPGKGKKKITKLLSFSLVSNRTYVFLLIRVHPRPSVVSPFFFRQKRKKARRCAAQGGLTFA